MDTSQHEAFVNGVKLSSVWLLVGITSWADFAAALAAIYSALLICEFVWKKVVRPFLERMGWVERRMRRKEDLK